MFTPSSRPHTPHAFTFVLDSGLRLTYALRGDGARVLSGVTGNVVRIILRDGRTHNLLWCSGGRASLDRALDQHSNTIKAEREQQERERRPPARTNRVQEERGVLLLPLDGPVLFLAYLELSDIQLSGKMLEFGFRNDSEGVTHVLWGRPEETALNEVVAFASDFNETLRFFDARTRKHKDFDITLAQDQNNVLKRLAEARLTPLNAVT